VPARFLRNYPNRRELRAIQVAGFQMRMIVAFVQAGRLGLLDRVARGLEAELAAQFGSERINRDADAARFHGTTMT
jgi:hypothetical protein